MIGLALALLLTDAEAAVRRFALLVANNEGISADNELLFAETDAAKVENVLVNLGGYAQQDVLVLLGQPRIELIERFGALRHAIDEARAAGDETVFLFYYSGHADDAGMQLGRTRLEYSELDAMLERSGADVRLAFIDACNSGELTRRKGGKLAPSFVIDVSERLPASGTVIITSSTGDEASQESDEIGGSYFTHYLVGGLSGSADGDGDNKVSLSETYDYVYRETVLRTSGTRLGTQHPTFEWDLAGEGDIVLTDLDPARSALVFPASMTGTWAVYDRERKVFVGEVSAGGGERRLAVRPGDYLVQMRYPTHLLVAEVHVGKNSAVNIAAAPMRAVEYEDDVAKGDIERQVRVAKRPDSVVRTSFGLVAPTNAAIEAAYLPTVPVAGLAYRVDWRRGQWLAVDLLGGTGLDTIVLPDTTMNPLQTRSSITTLGLSAGYATQELYGFSAGGGLRIAGTWWGRTVYENGQPTDQSLAALSPGAVGWVGFHPGRFVLDLELQRMVIPYSLDDDKSAFGTRAVLLGLGMRW